MCQIWLKRNLILGWPTAKNLLVRNKRRNQRSSGITKICASTLDNWKRRLISISIRILLILNMLLGFVIVSISCWCLTMWLRGNHWRLTVFLNQGHLCFAPGSLIGCSLFTWWGTNTKWARLRALHVSQQFKFQLKQFSVANWLSFGDFRWNTSTKKKLSFHQWMIIFQNSCSWSDRAHGCFLIFFVQIARLNGCNCPHNIGH